MMELIEKAGFCFVVSLLIGSLLTLIILKLSKKRTNHLKVDTLNSNINEKEKAMKRLEASYSKKKNQLNRLIDEGIVCRHQLLQKSNFLRKKSDELYRVEERLDKMKQKIAMVEDIESRNRILLNQISKLKKDSNPKQYSNSALSKEIKRLGKIIDERNQDIENLKDSAIDRKETYIELSKDQFHQIEKQLKEYKKKLELLEYNKNRELSTPNITKKESKLLDKRDLYLSTLKHIMLPDFFRESEKKTTKA
jgi:chromosome segregation ATPase